MHWNHQQRFQSTVSRRRHLGFGVAHSFAPRWRSKAATPDVSVTRESGVGGPAILTGIPHSLAVICVLTPVNANALSPASLIMLGSALFSRRSAATSFLRSNAA